MKQTWVLWFIRVLNGYCPEMQVQYQMDLIRYPIHWHWLELLSDISPYLAQNKASSYNLTYVLHLLHAGFFWASCN